MTESNEMKEQAQEEDILSNIDVESIIIFV